MSESVSKTQTCPKCGTISDQCIPIDASMRLSLQQFGQAGPFPDRACPSCYEKLTASVPQGMKLRMERDQREKNKMMMWKNRVHLIKNARNLMAQKAYSEAAVQYEKYLRVLEVVFGLKRGEISPNAFNNSSRSRELTVVASVYWDLLRIYDTNPRYGDRMQSAANKLAQFLPFSPIYPDIIKKADQFSRSCKNPAVVKSFLRACKARRGPCFIATAAFADEPDAVEVLWLRRYRDDVLRKTATGRRLIALYYRTSPPLARWIRGGERRRRITRQLITKIARRARKKLLL
jgi:hypothetical protein